MDLFKRLKDMLDGKDRKKLIENAVIIIIIGIIIIIAASTFLSGNKKNVDTASKAVDQKPEAAEVMAQSVNGDKTGEELAVLLSRVQGAGRVEVMITYVSGSENVPAYDTKKSESSTVEKDSDGGTRSISQGEFDSSVVYQDMQDGGKSPVILKELRPVVRGVVVVADGAASPEVKERICSAVQVLLDVPMHRIQVLQMKK